MYVLQCLRTTERRTAVRHPHAPARRAARAAMTASPPRVAGCMQTRLRTRVLEKKTPFAEARSAPITARRALVSRASSPKPTTTVSNELQPGDAKIKKQQKDDSLLERQTKREARKTAKVMMTMRTERPRKRCSDIGSEDDHLRQPSTSAPQAKTCRAKGKMKDDQRLVRFA